MSQGEVDQKKKSVLGMPVSSFSTLQNHAMGLSIPVGECNAFVRSGIQLGFKGIVDSLVLIIRCLLQIFHDK